MQVNTHFSAFFEIYSRPYRAKKKCKHFSSPEKKNTFGGEPPSSVGRLGRPRGPARGSWWLPTPDLGSTLGQRWVNLGSTLGQPSVTTTAISARFWLILKDSQMKSRDRRHVVHEMIDFPIGKRDFRVRAWSGAFWEPWREKKEKPKCIYSPS